MSGDVRVSVVAYEMKLSKEMLSTRHSSIKGIFVSSAPCICPLLTWLITVPVCYYCYCQGLDMATLLATIEPSFDKAPWRLCCAVMKFC